MTVAWFLLVSAIGTLIVLAFTWRRTMLHARKISLIAAMVPVAGWGVFYLTVLADWGSFDFKVGFSRWIVLGTYASFTFQAWAIAQSEPRDG